MCDRPTLNTPAKDRCEQKVFQKNVGFNSLSRSYFFLNSAFFLSFVFDSFTPKNNIKMRYKVNTFDWLFYPDL